MNEIKFITDQDVIKNNWIGGFSQFEKKIIKKYSVPPILHLFSGNSEIGKLRVDINPFSRANIVKNVFDFIKLESEKKEFNYNTIILDPIYSSEERKEIWRKKYKKNTNIKEKELFIFPYDTRKTKILWNFFQIAYPKIIIIKSLSHYTIPDYKLKQGFDIYMGAFKPNRCLSIFERKNNSLKNFL